MKPVEKLPPAEKRKLLVRLLEERVRKVAPVLVPGPDQPQDFDRFAIPVRDLKPEVVLDPGIRFDAPPVEQNGEPADILLTGATGFLGAFLLYDLLNQTEARIHCLIRCSDPEQGRKRICKTLETYFPARGWQSDRIIAVPGDLSKPLFGLPAREFERLATGIDLIYHNAALVNLLYSYNYLKPTNVLGTHEAIRFAASGKMKPLHYVSSVSACPLEESPGVQVVREIALGDADGVLYGGYSQSKWVAEQLVIQARSRNLPACIYRPGIIIGDSRTGAWSTSDATSRMIKLSVESGITPDIDAAMDMTPIDYVSRAIVHLSKAPQAMGKIYHLANPRPVHVRELVSWIRSFGYPIRRIPYEAWRSEMVALSGHFSIAQLFSMPILDKMPARMTSMLAANYQSGVDSVISAVGARYAAQAVRLDCENTARDLDGTPIACPVVDDQLMNTYLSYFIRVGFLKAQTH
ncbi:MAG: thioester reductase domain-containing protein [Pyrinomonadaceae bacterium]